jgi:hypothetical protein
VGVLGTIFSKDGYVCKCCIGGSDRIARVEGIYGIKNHVRRRKRMDSHAKRNDSNDTRQKKRTKKRNKESSITSFATIKYSYIFLNVHQNLVEL